MTEKDSKLHTDKDTDDLETGGVISEEDAWKQAEELARELKRGLEKSPGRNTVRLSDKTNEVTRESKEESSDESEEELPGKLSKGLLDDSSSEVKKVKPQADLQSTIECASEKVEDTSEKAENDSKKEGKASEKKKPQPGDGKSASGAAPKKKKKKSAASYAISFFIKLAVTALVIFLLLTFVVGLYVNHSNSSYPMLKDGDLCLTYRLATLVKGDEIAYEKDGTIRFGRIVGTAGDVVDITDGSITVNGYGVFEDAVYPTTAEGAKITFPYKVPEEAVFVLNDYRSDPTDSRAYGAIPLSETKGKVILVLRRRGI